MITIVGILCIDMVHGYTMQFSACTDILCAVVTLCLWMDAPFSCMGTPSQCMG